MNIASALTPKRVLITLAVLSLAVIVFAPRDATFSGDSRLTSYSTDPDGALGFYDTMRRLGWRVARRTEPLHKTPASDVTYLVLAPPEGLTAGEAHVLLDAVRGGAGLIFTPRRGDALSDSLKLDRSSRSLLPVPLRQRSDTLRPGRRAPDEGGVGGARHSIVARAPLPRDTVVLTSTLFSSRGRRPTVVLGLPLGRGRVVAVADPSLFRNDALREGWPAVAVIRAVEWARPASGGEGGGGARSLVFDEYHQGFGPHPHIAGTVVGALGGTAPGRMVLQVLLAALILLLAVSPRPIAPAPRATIERRSPLEHVGALARAYEQVGATRTVAHRLLRGLRRRRSVGAWRAATDDAFLESLRARYPSLGADLSLVTRALREPAHPRELGALRDAIVHIERTMNS